MEELRKRVKAKRATKAATVKEALGDDCDLIALVNAAEREAFVEVLAMIDERLKEKCAACHYFTVLEGEKYDGLCGLEPCDYQSTYRGNSCPDWLTARSKEAANVATEPRT